MPMYTAPSPLESQSRKATGLNSLSCASDIKISEFQIYSALSSARGNWDRPPPSSSRDYPMAGFIPPLAPPSESVTSIITNPAPGRWATSRTVRGLCNNRPSRIPDRCASQESLTFMVLILMSKYNNRR
jgi:hypothetical protein